MRTNRVVAFIAIATVCGTLALSLPAPAWAVTGSRPTRSPNHAAHIIIYAVNTDGPYYRAVLSGAIGDYGPAVAVFPNGKVDQEHDHQLELKLTEGSFRLNIVQLEKEFLAHVVVPQPQFKSTCSDYINFTISSVPIVAGSGTGLYRGVKGSFNLTATVDETQQRPCVGTLKKGAEVIAMVGSGTVSM